MNSVDHITDEIMDYDQFLEYIKSNIENEDFIIPDIDIINTNYDNYDEKDIFYNIKTTEVSGGRLLDFSEKVRENINLILDGKSKVSLNIKRNNIGDISENNLDLNIKEVYLQIHYILALNKIINGIEDIKTIAENFTDFLSTSNETNGITKIIARSTKTKLTPATIDISVAFPFQFLKSLKSISNIKYFAELEKATKKELLLQKIIGNYIISIKTILSELKKNIDTHILLLQKLEKKLLNSNDINENQKNIIENKIIEFRDYILRREKDFDVFQNRMLAISTIYFLDGFDVVSKERINIESIKISKFTSEERKSGALKTLSILKNLLNDIKEIDDLLMEKIGRKLDNFVKKDQIILSVKKTQLEIGNNIYGDEIGIPADFLAKANFDIADHLSSSHQGITIQHDNEKGIVNYIANIDGLLKFAFNLEKGVKKIKMTLINSAKVDVIEVNLNLNTDIIAREIRRNVQTTGNVNIEILKKGSNVGGNNINITDSEGKTNIVGRNVGSDGIIKSSVDATGDVKIRNFLGTLIKANNIELNAGKGVNSYSSILNCGNLQGISSQDEIKKNIFIEEGHENYCTITANRINIGTLNGEQQNFILLQNGIIDSINKYHDIKWIDKEVTKDDDFDKENNNFDLENSNITKWFFKKPTAFIIGLSKRVDFIINILNTYNANLKTLEIRRGEFYKKLSKLFAQTHNIEKLTSIFGKIEKKFKTDMSIERDNLKFYNDFISSLYEWKKYSTVDPREIKTRLEDNIRLIDKMDNLIYLNHLSSLIPSELEKELSSYFTFIRHEFVDENSGDGKFEIDKSKLFKRICAYLMEEYIEKIYLELKNIDPKPGYDNEFKAFFNHVIPISMSDKYLLDIQTDLDNRKQLLSDIASLSGDQELNIKYNCSNKSIVQIDNILFSESILKGNAIEYLIELRKRNIFKYIGNRNIPIIKGKGISIKVEGGYIHYNAEIIFEQEVVGIINSLDNSIFMPFASKKVKPKVDDSKKGLIYKKEKELKEKLLTYIMDSLTTPTSREDFIKNGISKSLILQTEEERISFENEIMDKIGGMGKLLYGVGNAFKK